MPRASARQNSRGFLNYCPAFAESLRTSTPVNAAAKPLLTRRAESVRGSGAPLPAAYRQTMKQVIFYEPIKAWLAAKGFRCLVTGERTRLVIPVSDLAPAIYKIPDLIGVNENNRVVIVEVEKNNRLFFDALGRCMLWKSVATFVYLAYPKDEIPHARVLGKLGIGLLEVDCNSRAVNEKGPLLEGGRDLHAVLELHPTDFRREQQLADLIRDTLA